jgi:SAM-dependent methyltransferase
MIQEFRQGFARLWRTIEIVAISNGGERVTHLYPNDCYFAHLSLYRFASQFSLDKRALDAGSGTGYGAAYLADHGAQQVIGLELSADGVALSRSYFQRPNLRFVNQDIQQLSGIPEQSIDLLVCSNVLEHLPDVRHFLRECCRVLDENGYLLIAVPPVIHDGSRAENLANPYHINVWSPRQWHSTLKSYFIDVQCFRHVPTLPGAQLNFANQPHESKVTERDFAFLPVTLDEWLEAPTLTSVLLARRPRDLDSLPNGLQPIVFVDDSVTKPVATRRSPWWASLSTRAYRAALPPASRRWQLGVIAQRAWRMYREPGIGTLFRKMVSLPANPGSHD